MRITTALTASFWVVQVLRTLLYQTPPRDTATFVFAVLLLVVAAAIAGCFQPVEPRE